ncbi:putative non-specific serine/threonine protein kinase [Helianthus annuus]|nr:putative non-specific serine/threonine protein kinase [Helianthus annuus]
MRLSNLSLMGNRLSGRFPTALTKIATLLYLSIEGNRFSGPIPKEIANLKNLDKLDLSSNDFTGHLPAALAKLTNLTYLRICDNNFTGKIPNFISQWTQIERLDIQGSSFEGPIPSSIFALTQLRDLRISDLKGGGSTFPSLENMLKLSILVLRNCLIHGKIPNYFKDMMYLNTIPQFQQSSFSQLENVDHIYLTKNNLTGAIPGWVLSSTKNVDVSYNHFTWDASSETWWRAILRQQMNKINSLHINCGGEEVNINNTIYESDIEKNGASSYYNDGNWAFSSTGNFFNDDHDSNAYILSNTSNLHNISPHETELYLRARTAAISLTYYGLCLMNGKYKVMHLLDVMIG